MGQALGFAGSTHAYVLSDRSTWLAKPRDLVILVQGDPRLFNQFSAMLVNPATHPNVKAEAGKKFVNWITSRRGRAAIEAYQVNGQRLYFPNADFVRSEDTVAPATTR
jgi:tungstate transport system substrate-binding protein